VYYAKFGDNGETSVYGFVLFGKVVYVKVRYRERIGKNMFTWLLDPVVEKVALNLDEVTSDES